MRTLVWSLAALGLCVPLVEVYGRSTLSQATTQPEQVERSTHLLKWVGRETIKMHYSIGATYARRGNHDEAIAHYRRSLELFPTGRVWLALGSEYRALGRREEAREAFSAAIALNPNIAAPQEPRALKTEHP
jgi:tetratricopeptide (TPR) repeat protein